jgi:broad specificity phosphatase PhoE
LPSIQSTTSSRPTFILLARHADVLNPEQVLYGRLPRFRLSDQGIGQARRLATFLSEIRLGAIYTSPQLRARQTARFIALHHPEVKPKVSRLIAEVLVGWQGMRERELPPGLNYYLTPKDPTDESLDTIFARFSRFVKRTLARHPGQVVLAVSHGDPIKTVTMGLIGAALEPATFRRYDIPAKSSVTCLRYDGSFADGPTISYVDTTRLRDGDRLRLGQR